MSVIYHSVSVFRGIFYYTKYICSRTFELDTVKIKCCSLIIRQSVHRFLHRILSRISIEDNEIFFKTGSCCGICSTQCKGELFIHKRIASD